MRFLLIPKSPKFWEKNLKQSDRAGTFKVKQRGSNALPVFAWVHDRALA